MVGMCKNLIAILSLFFLLQQVAGQPVNDVTRSFGKLSSIEILSVAQQKKSAISIAGKQLSLFIFLSPECPLCQNYSKTLKGLQERFDQQVNLYGIFPGNAYTLHEVLAFETRYNTRFNLFIDQKKQLTNYLHASATPQAILLDNKGNLLYTGAIDDWVQGLGKKRLKASKHYLSDAIEQSLRSEEVTVKHTKAFGCKINDY
jgi:thioredoxin-related protein